MEISNYNRCGNPLTETWITCHGGQRTERLPLFSNLFWVKNKKGAIGKAHAMDADATRQYRTPL